MLIHKHAQHQWHYAFEAPKKQTNNKKKKDILKNISNENHSTYIDVLG